VKVKLTATRTADRFSFYHILSTYDMCIIFHMQINMQMSLKQLAAFVELFQCFIFQFYLTLTDSTPLYRRNILTYLT